MKARHVLAIALLVVWQLAISEPGRTIPRDCHCGVFGAHFSPEIGGEFKTKSQCEEATKDLKSNFYMKAGKYDDQL